MKKTKFIIFTNNQSELKSIPPLKLGSAIIERVGLGQAETCVRFLGLWVDSGLDFKQQIIKLKNKLNSGLYFLSQAKVNSPLRIRLSIYRALIESQLRYASIIYGSAPISILESLFKLQKNAIRHVNNSFYRAHTDPLFEKYKLLKLDDLIDHARASIIHQFRGGRLPPSFKRDFFIFISDAEFTRTNDPMFVRIPEVNEPSLSRNPYLMICKAWNKVPYDIKMSQKYSEFKSQLTQHYITKYNAICTTQNCFPCRKSLEESAFVT